MASLYGRVDGTDRSTVTDGDGASPAKQVATVAPGSGRHRPHHTAVTPTAAPATAKSAIAPATAAARDSRVGVGSRMVEGAPKAARSVRTMALLGGAADALRAQRAQQDDAQLAAGPAWRDEGLIFTTRTGAGLSGNNVDRAFRRVRDRAGVRALPLYSMRHATASILLGAGVPVAVAAKMMGHSVALFSETYADLLVEATHDAARQADEWLARQSASGASVPSPRDDSETPHGSRGPGRAGAAPRRRAGGPLRDERLMANQAQRPLISQEALADPLCLKAFSWWARWDSNPRPAD